MNNKLSIGCFGIMLTLDTSALRQSASWRVLSYIAAPDLTQLGLVRQIVRENSPLRFGAHVLFARLFFASSLLWDT